MHVSDAADVVRAQDISSAAIIDLAANYSIELHWLSADAPISYSYWGAPEAGISRDGISLRGDTPLHSVLHELCHIVCMTAQRREQLERDAGGTDIEECGVCYLQVLLADQLPGIGSHRCLADMEAWGYSFREGSARGWFRGDGREARDWLRVHGLIGADDRPTWALRS